MEDITRRMLETIRRKQQESRNKTMETPEEYNRRMVTEEANRNPHGREGDYKIKKDDVKFGKLLIAQEDQIRKTVGSVELDDDNALSYYLDENGDDDLVLNGRIPSINVAFQFRYNDPSGDGCYIWGDGIQMSDSNSTKVQELRNAFLNWKDGINKDGTIMKDLKNAVKSKED